MKQFLNRIPFWGFMLVLLAVATNSVYLVNMYRIIFIGAEFGFEDGKYISSTIAVRGPAKEAGLQTGDIILAIDSTVLTEQGQLKQIYDSFRVGEPVVFKIARNSKEFNVTLIPSSYMLEAPVFYYLKFILVLLFSFACLYILVKKTGDRSVRLFFIYFQLFLIVQLAYYLRFTNLFANVATIIFLFSTFLSGPALIHFILLFPQPAKIYSRLRQLVQLLYGIGFLLASFFSTYYILSIYYPTPEFLYKLVSVNRIVVSWVLLSFCIAMVLTIYQSRTIKTTIARNQLRMVFIGSFFGYSIPMAYALFYHFLFSLDSKYPFIFYEFAQGITHIILIICFLIALFRYRIWDIELYIKKVLLYLGATLVITLTYLVLVFFVNRLTEGESDVIRFLALVVSVISFLVLRDRIQQLIDRLFQRETYDTATVVSDFEAKLTGIYRFDELKQKIGQRIDEIFHFNSFVFSLKTADLVYDPAFAFGSNDLLTGSEIKINHEFEEKLLKSKVFSPEELNQKPLILRETNEELVVPLVADGRPAGFFICGRKKSERIYSRQDIQLLSLLARRVVALLHTASLYQKDLDRQFMLERERARISQDMHDEVGASLTRISILSELAKSRSDIPAETSQWLGQISDTSRGVMEEMSQIIWALNPKNDTLEGLVSYLRRFTFEYLEPSPVTCLFELPEAIPDIALSVEVRRNVYLVVREALHNMVKHSGAVNVWISMNLDGSRFIIRVKDDGHGFDPVNLQFPGNGLNNMKKRMNDISGEFQLTSQVGEGTEIRLVVPVY